jgi:hypothetical protein
LPNWYRSETQLLQCLKGHQKCALLHPRGLGKTVAIRLFLFGVPDGIRPRVTAVKVVQLAILTHC